MATPAQALGMLRANPEVFLKNYYVMADRDVANGSGQSTYYFGATGMVRLDGTIEYNRTARPGAILGSWRTHMSKNFKFSVNPALLAGATEKLRVWHVDVQHSSDIGEHDRVPALAVSRSDGPDLMVTTLLNGCTFMCEPVENAVLMAHVRPMGKTGAALHADMGARRMEGGGLRAHGAYGAATDDRADQQDVTIIGVRGYRQWKVFAQRHPRNQRTIQKVECIFNG